MQLTSHSLGSMHFSSSGAAAVRESSNQLAGCSSQRAIGCQSPCEVGSQLYTGGPYLFGDIFEGLELSPEPSPVLADNPVLDGFVRLCNMNEECDELNFTFAPL